MENWQEQVDARLNVPTSPEFNGRDRGNPRKTLARIPVLWMRLEATFHEGQSTALPLVATTTFASICFLVSLRAVCSTYHPRLGFIASKYQAKSIHVKIFCYFFL